MIRRKPIEDDEENPERWLVSYADFITLLFAFFVVMYAISSVNQSKYSDLTSSMGSAFSGVNPSDTEGHIKNKTGTNNKIKGQQSSLIKPLPLSHLYQEKLRRDREAMTNTGVAISNALAPLIHDEKIRVSQNNRGIRIDIHDSVLFSPGSAELASAATEIMSEIAMMLKDNQRQIQVEGHTDNVEIHTPVFFSNWELSAVRATTVVRMLSSAGIQDSRLSALGFGSAQPISDNESLTGRAKNRRVSIMILYESQNQEDSALEIMPHNSL
jgi:chemotaxis protein MotB